MVRAAVCAVVSATLPACGLEKSYPEKDTFVLHSGTLDRSPAVRGGVLRVESVRISPPYDKRRLVYRTGDLAMRPDYYNVFVADPEDLATGELVRLLSESGTFSDVLEPASTASARLRLECTITDLYADVRTAEARGAVCRARYRLLQEEPGRTVVAGDWTFEERSPMTSDSGAAGAGALGLAFGETVRAFVAAVSEQPAASPR